MSLPRTIDEIEYPESDGTPMGESQLHQNWMIYILQVLRHRYRDQQVHVASNLFVYFEQGNPRAVCAPDNFVVKECDPSPRRTFKTWEEQRVPNVVFEVTSSSTRTEDTNEKPRKFATMRIPEYFLYDPTGDYLIPPLQGFRLTNGQYQSIQPNPDGSLNCHELSVRLCLEKGDVAFYDAAGGARLLTGEEAAETARRKAEAERQKEKAQRRKAEGERQKEKAQRHEAEAERDLARARAEAAELRVAELEEELRRKRE